MTDISATGIGSTDPTATATGLAPAVAASGVGNPPAANGSGANGSGAASGTNTASPLPVDNLAWAKAKGWVADDGNYKVADIAKGYQELEKHLGTLNRVPDEKAAPEEWDKFNKSRGWPGDVKGYEFKLPDNLPPELPYNQKLADTFKEVFNAERLPVKTAQNLHDKFVQVQADMLKADVQAMADNIAKQATTAHETYVKEWGDPKSEAYKQNTEAARRALQGDPKLQGLEAKLKQTGLLTKEGHFTNFEIGHLLANHGKQFMNDKFVTPNGQGRTGENPFARTGADGKPNPSFNVTEAARLVKQNPVEAKRLIVAAGDDPASYGFT